MVLLLIPALGATVRAPCRECARLGRGTIREFKAEGMRMLSGFPSAEPIHAVASMLRSRASQCSGAIQLPIIVAVQADYTSN